MKIAQLNESWPHIVATYQARVREEVHDRALFLRRFEAACRGDMQNTTLAFPLDLAAAQHGPS